MNIPEHFDTPEFRRALIAYSKMRIKIKKPMTTKRTETLLWSKLNVLSNRNVDLAIKILDQSTFNCWQGIFELKEKPKVEPRKEDSYRADSEEPRAGMQTVMQAVDEFYKKHNPAEWKRRLREREKITNQLLDKTKNVEGGEEDPLPF